MDLEFLKVTNEAGRTSRLDLFGEIGGSYWDQSIDEASVAEALAGIPDNEPLEVSINSPGGSVFAALAIHSLLKRRTGETTIRVAGLAASAATIITSIPNAKVVMPKGSLMLIHPVRISVDSKTPQELKEAAANLEKISGTVRDIYEAKTGLPSEKLDELMSTESFLTAKEAVEMGFADELDETTSVKNTLSGDTAVINGLRMPARLFAHAPEGILEKKPMDLETFKSEHRNIYEAVLAEGMLKERQRLQAIEEIAVAGHEDLVAQAKFGDKPMTAEALAVAILKADKAKAQTLLRDRNEDAADLAAITNDANTGLMPNAEAKAAEDAQMRAFIETGRKAFAGAA